MSHNYISSVYVEKLGHNIQEIRERALFNLLSKLERGFIYDNELARCKEIILNLFNWFRFTSFAHEDVVLQLIKRILMTESGRLLIDLFGAANLEDEFKTIKRIVASTNHGIIDELINLVNSMTVQVPPLLSDVPLSYRTDDCVENIFSTATTIEGVVHQSESAEDENRCESTNRNTSKSDLSLPYYALVWQPIVSPDRHVLESIEDSLRNPTQPSAVLNSCEFFTHVLLQDFPAEIFLQRPLIIKLFHDLLWSSPSSRIATAILNCLQKLSAALKTRIYYYSDPSTQNFKLCNLTLEESFGSSPNLQNSNLHNVELIEDTVSMMKKGMSVQQFCLNSILSVFDYLFIPPESGDQFKRKKCLVGINTSLVLLHQNIDLLGMCVKKIIWENTADELNKMIIDKIDVVLVKFGETLTHFRLEVISSDWNEDCRLIHLHLLVAFTNLIDNLIPLQYADRILPKNLKNAIANSIMDPAFSCLFPNVHETLILITKQFESNFESESCKKYDEHNLICDSMVATIKLLRNWKNLTMIQNISLAKSAVKSLELHKATEFISIYINICANKLSLYSFEDELLSEIDDILLNLLSHKSEDIKLETYKICQKKIISTIGAKLNISKASSPGTQILFLLRCKVLQEITVHGCVDRNVQVQNFAEDILIHILKCKILVCNEIWQQALQAILPVIPLLICHVSGSTLGRTVLNILDPDRGNSLNIPVCDIIKGNAGLLFSESSRVREEAVSKLCWLLSSREQSRNLLPHINNLHDKALALICQPERLIDYRQFRNTQHFYQPSGLHQVIDLLNSQKVEPVIRRSAVTQISVMSEDPILHSTFVEKGGVALIMKIMYSALMENNYNDYPDSTIACITILKNICLYNSTVRLELSSNLEYYHLLLRGMFMFCTEERVKQDGSVLLFLLVYANYILGSPIKNDLSLPSIILNKMKSPFNCKAHWIVSENTLPSFCYFLSDKWTLSSLQIHWNIEWFGGLNEILKVAQIKYDKTANFSESFKLKPNDLLAIKSTSLEYIIQKYLKAIKSGNSHVSVMGFVTKLTICLNLYNILKSKAVLFEHDITTFQWAESFDRYLNTPPSGVDDNIMLGHILQFLKMLAPLFNNTEKPFWICGMLKSDNSYLSELLGSDGLKEADVKQLMHSLFDLIIACVLNEQHRIDFLQIKNCIENTNWSNLTCNIIEHLQFDDAQHYYNLAYLDHLLSTLIHLTSAFGWSNSKPDEPINKYTKQLIIGLCDLIRAFHCGKGVAAANSLMGLSITRNAVLILNHVMAEMRQFNVKNWEQCFISDDLDINGESSLMSLCTLCQSRDIILRTAILQLLSGLAKSPHSAITLVQDIKIGNMEPWEFAISTLLDHEEANTVKENATILLTNLISHTIIVNDEITILKSVLPVNIKWSDGAPAVNTILKLLDEHNFYSELDIILRNLYTECYLYMHDLRYINLKDDSPKGDEIIVLYSKNMNTYRSVSSSRSSANQYAVSCMVTTPGVVKSIAMFLHNLVIVAMEDVCFLLQEYGIIKLFLKCLSIPNIEIETTKDITLYCDILEMNTAICLLLACVITKNVGSLVTICNTRDCLNVMLSLLNPNLFMTSLPRLLYLRNKLWSSIFTLIEMILINSHNEIGGLKSMEAFTVITSIISDNGQESFLQSLCESINNTNSTDLQLTALSSLTSLLSLDNDDNNDNKSQHSMQTLLDLTKTPRTPQIEKKVSEEITKFNILQKSYFGNLEISNKNLETPIVNDGECQMAGAELCNILLRLYEIVHLKNLKNKHPTPKRRFIIINALTGLLLVSQEAKTFALKDGLIAKIIEQLKEIYIKLSLENIDCLRRISDKKRVSPVLKELESFLGLITNFMHANCKVKNAAATFGLADVCHKLWNWFSTQNSLLVAALNMLCTFTTDCNFACQSITLTSSVAGSGPRKVPSNLCLLQVICTQIAKEMEKVSKTHNLMILQLCLHLLINCNAVIDCRNILIKSNLLNSLSRLHPAITKNQKPWRQVELLWLEFLSEFSSYPEGQSSLGKLPDILDLIMTFTSSPKAENRELALEILRNLSFYTPNRSRLLTSDDFLNTLSTKLSSGTLEEKNLVILIIWALAANNQKAKLVFKCAHMDNKIQDTIKLLQFSNIDVKSEDLERMHSVLRLLKDGEKSR